MSLPIDLLTFILYQLVRYKMPIPNLNIYSASEVTAIAAAVKAERLRRITGGAITQGNKNGRSFSVELMSESELSNLENALAAKLNVRGANKRRINFNNGIAGY